MRKLVAACCVLMIAPAISADEGADEGPAGLEVWSQMFEVISHPRCSNCHVDEKGVPMWSGPSYGTKPKPHGLGVVVGNNRDGVGVVPCKSCHGKENAPFPHGPPGAEGWRLPPAEFAWFGEPEASICRQFRNPETNGGRGIEDLAEHSAHDGLLFWSWHPGSGRETPPYSQAEFADMIRAWGAAGAPCPEAAAE